MMVTENLGALGYKMVDKKYGLDLEHSELVMKVSKLFRLSLTVMLH